LRDGRALRVAYKLGGRKTRGLLDRRSTLRHRHQKLVAGGVLQGVVDILELIEIERKNGEIFHIPAHAQQGFV
jgi:hypothetical protein